MSSVTVLFKDIGALARRLNATYRRQTIEVILVDGRRMRGRLHEPIPDDSGAALALRGYELPPRRDEPPPEREHIVYIPMDQLHDWAIVNDH
jgi:hypothetical protein